MVINCNRINLGTGTTAKFSALLQIFKTEMFKMEDDNIDKIKFWRRYRAGTLMMPNSNVSYLCLCFRHPMNRFLVNKMKVLGNKLLGLKESQ